MTSPEQDPLDRALEQLLAADQAPPRLTANVLRRIEEAQWRRERFLSRVLYAGVVGGGALALSALFFVPALPADSVMVVAVAAVVLTIAATWRRLVPQL